MSIRADHAHSHRRLGKVRVALGLVGKSLRRRALAEVATNQSERRSVVGQKQLVPSAARQVAHARIDLAAIRFERKR